MVSRIWATDLSHLDSFQSDTPVVTFVLSAKSASVLTTSYIF